jgi:hypothetical protein
MPVYGYFCGYQRKQQRERVERYCVDAGLMRTRDFTDHYTCKETPLQDRPQGKLLLQFLQPGDEVVFAGLGVFAGTTACRWSTSTADCLRVVKWCAYQGITPHLPDARRVVPDYYRRITLKILVGCLQDKVAREEATAAVIRKLRIELGGISMSTRWAATAVGCLQDKVAREEATAALIREVRIESGARRRAALKKEGLSPAELRELEELRELDAKLQKVDLELRRTSKNRRLPK